jgi:hypothetical protein
MKWLNMIIPILILSVSCTEREKTTATNSMSLATIKQDVIKKESVEKPYNNAVFVCGSSFGIFFQSLYRLNKHEDMLQFTSQKSRKQFGDKAILEFYRNNYEFDFQLNKLTSIHKKKGETSYLVYANAIILGTRRKVVLETVNENDSIHLVIRKLKNPFRYLPE